MSRTLNDGVFVEYPNATHFAFVPAIVRVTGVSEQGGAKQCDVTLSINGRNYTESRETYKGACIFDIQRYLQTAFDEVDFSDIDYQAGVFAYSPLKKTVGIMVNGTGGHEVLDDYIDVIWGAISARESSGGNVHRKWFVNFPFTVDVLADSKTRFNMNIDNGKKTASFGGPPSGTGPTGYRMALLDPSGPFEAFGPTFTVDNVKRSVRFDITGAIILENDEERIGAMSYTLEVDRSREGVYLRWIDRQGRYCYYLFRDLGSTAGIAALMTWERNDMAVPTAYVSGVNIGTTVRQQFAQKTTRTLGAHLVDRETYDFLLSLARAVVVDVFDGYNDDDIPQWHRVNIVPASYEKTTKCFQDFIFSIEEPAQSAQLM